MNEQGQHRVLPPSPFDTELGTKWLSTDPAGAHARLEMQDRHRQPMGIMHGGVIASVIESLCSMATGVAVFPENRIAMGQSISINFLRPVSDGAIDVRAVAEHAGRMTWVWRATVTDSEGKVCAISNMTVAVREAPEGVDLAALARGAVEGQGQDELRPGA